MIMFISGDAHNFMGDHTTLLFIDYPKHLTDNKLLKQTVKNIDIKSWLRYHMLYQISQRSDIVVSKTNAHQFNWI